MRGTTFPLLLSTLCHLSLAIPWSAQNQHPFAPVPKSPEITGTVTSERQDAVKEAFLFAWNGYKNYSWGADENRPVSNTPSNSRFITPSYITNSKRTALRLTSVSHFLSTATIVDSLDTLWLMGLQDDFALARKHVAKINWRDTRKNLVDAFETNIRYIGGLLGAYDLSGDHLFLDKAIELADLLLPIFDSPTGLPYQFIDFSSGQPVKSGYPRGASILAEIGSFQLEFTHISQLTGNWTYHHKAQRANDFFDGLRRTHQYPPGLFPILVDIDNGEFTTSTCSRVAFFDGVSVFLFTLRKLFPAISQAQITYGGLGDSFYEYLIKQFILSDGTNDQLHRLSLESVQSLEKYLLSSPVNRTDLVFLAQLVDGKQRNGMDELVCL
ncbi:LOW QUALITY PROTEIN: hypothetical protein BC936DRAFT_147844 [Jimgerdemannia flammicorona]|uniref:alpha-1,2-Mannosidase n=1 Tax=Jimgerdemannia flammicorona TaxID=994334 RepID=A0A433D4D8_9FUNG|nr:LOW QUALITY PROTEIN: hypothetical protein BC936DRAFT_147844 [Jimgerdemannia flammicorona]